MAHGVYRPGSKLRVIVQSSFSHDENNCSAINCWSMDLAGSGGTVGHGSKADLSCKP